SIATSKFRTPGPYVSVGGVLPIPSELIAGKAKLCGLKLYHRFGSALASAFPLPEYTDEGVAPESRNNGPFIWQRNGIPPVGVPVQYPSGAPLAEQPIVKAWPK